MYFSCNFSGISIIRTPAPKKYTLLSACVPPPWRHTAQKPSFDSSIKTEKVKSLHIILCKTRHGRPSANKNQGRMRSAAGLHLLLQNASVGTCPAFTEDKAVPFCPVSPSAFLSAAYRSVFGKIPWRLSFFDTLRYFQQFSEEMPCCKKISHFFRS